MKSGLDLVLPESTEMTHVMPTLKKCTVQLGEAVM